MWSRFKWMERHWRILHRGMTLSDLVLRKQFSVVLRIHSSEAWVKTRTLVKWLSEKFRQVYNNGGLDQGDSSGQVMHIFWRQNQKDFLTDWRWGLRERGRVKNHSNSFEGKNWKYGLAIGADMGFEGPKFSIQFWGPTSGKWTQDYKTKLDIW